MSSTSIGLGFDMSQDAIHESKQPTKSGNSSSNNLSSNNVSSSSSSASASASTSTSPSSFLSPFESMLTPWKSISGAPPVLSEDIWSIIRGFRNGALYGIKIRLPHAIIMTLIFSNSSNDKKFWSVVNKTSEHSLHLGQFVAVYKLLIVCIRRALGYEHNRHPLIHILAGGIGGGLVWGQRTSVNHQINLYVLSRIFMGLMRSGIERGWWPNYGNAAYILFASLTWAVVMFLFEFEEKNLSKSLAASMRYLYHNEMKNPFDFKSFWYWVNHSSPSR